MATILLLGTDEALLEGLVQTLTALGHQPVLTHDAVEAVQAASSKAPLLAVMDQDALRADPRLLRLPLQAGGCIVLYRQPGTKPAALPQSHRNVIAELVLPLERNRLVALVHSVEERARITGREKDREVRTQPRV
jgi:DNA-binding NtrC family response regulator